MVKATKRILRRTVGDRALTYSEYHLYLKEAEAAINSRPLTSAVEPGVSALTPGHFIWGRPASCLPAERFQEHDVRRLEEGKSIDSLGRWRMVSALSGLFWKIWSDQYLTALQTRQKWLKPARNFKVGDVVHVEMKDEPRLRWPIGVIVRVHESPTDGKIRAVEVMTSKARIEDGRPVFQDGQPVVSKVTIKRGVSHLALLEETVDQEDVVRQEERRQADQVRRQEARARARNYQNR